MVSAGDNPNPHMTGRGGGQEANEISPTDRCHGADSPETWGEGDDEDQVLQCDCAKETDVT